MKHIRRHQWRSHVYQTLFSYRLFVILIMVWVSGCQSSPGTQQLTPEPPDPQTGHFRARSNAVDIVTNKTVNMNEFRPLVYVKMNSYGPIEPSLYTNYLMSAFENMGYFDQVVTSQPMIYINTSPRDSVRIVENSLWYNETDLQSIPELRAQYQDFVVVQATLRSHVPLNNQMSFELKFIDPNDGTEIITFRTQGNARSGVDLNLINPALNAAQDWLGHIS